MKTDDDAFVRVDEVLLSLQRIGTTRGLLYGLINSDSHPHRDPDSKWYISLEVIRHFILSFHLYYIYFLKSITLPQFFGNHSKGLKIKISQEKHQ